MGAYVLEWLDLAVRWFHVVAGISWIGTSFYFVWLDDNLTRPQREGDRARGVAGELWSVHGGGFYHNQKLPIGPKGEALAERLHWFKWEAYFTWLSGVAMLAIVYWSGARTFLIDRSVMNLTPPEAIGISIASLAIGWFVYDALCRALSRRPLALGVAVFAFLLFTSWALFHVFSARAAYIHVGAIIGTIMAVNVFAIIIPGQKKMVDAIRAGREPDPRLGALGKTRSVHNTYLTLPVIFTMISFHYPMTYGGRYGWLVLGALGLAGVLVRYFFILTHRQRLVVALPAAAIAILVVTAFLVAPHAPASATGRAVSFAQVAPIFAQRCAVCHSTHPTQTGFSAPPEGVLLDTPEHIAANAARVEAEAVASNAMPLGNITGMTPAERALVGAWIAEGAKP